MSGRFISDNKLVSTSIYCRACTRYCHFSVIWLLGIVGIECGVRIGGEIQSAAAQNIQLAVGIASRIHKEAPMRIHSGIVVERQYALLHVACDVHAVEIRPNTVVKRYVVFPVRKIIPNTSSAINRTSALRIPFASIENDIGLFCPDRKYIIGSGAVENHLVRRIRREIECHGRGRHLQCAKRSGIARGHIGSGLGQNIGCTIVTALEN